MKTKKLTKLVICILFSTGLGWIVYDKQNKVQAATSSVTVFYHYEQLEIPSEQVVEKNGRIYMPVRYVLDRIGGTLTWDEKEQKVTLSKGSTVLTFWINKKGYLYNGKWIHSSVTPFLQGDRTMLPIRPLAEHFHLYIEWESLSHRVLIAQSASVLEDIKALSRDSVLWLARIIAAEAEGESFQGQIAVGAVVMNRVESEGFPNTIYGVIFDKYGPHYQFEPVLNGRIHTVQPSAMNVEAARRALAGEDPTNGAQFFFNPSISSNAWMSSKSVSMRIGNHVFIH